MKKIKFIVIMVFLSLSIIPAYSQDKDKDKGKKDVHTIYDEGFWMVGDDDKLKIIAWTQEDYRLYRKDYPLHSTFLNRRTRVGVMGVLENVINYQIIAAFERSTDLIQFAWVEYGKYPEIKFRAGQFKEPYSREELQADLYLDLLERSLMNNLSPAQDLGVMLSGKLANDIFEYGIGAFNGRGRNKEDNTNDKDIAGRLDIAPFKTANIKALNNFYIGGAFTSGTQEESFKGVSYKTAGQTKFWTYNDSVSFNDKRTRIEADMEWIYGPASIKGEWSTFKFNNVMKGSITRDISFNGFMTSATILITGEAKTRSKPIVPKRDFNPLDGKWGALEFAARYEMFEAKDNPISQGFASGTDKVTAFSLGLNWTLNKHVRLSANYVNTKFDDSLHIGTQNIDNENLFLFRFQFEL